MNYVYLYVIGAAQGLVLAIALWLKQVNVRSNRLLAVWTLLLVFDLCIKAVYLNNQQTRFFPVYTLALFLPFLYGSLFYLYVRTITLKKPLQWRDVIHFAGFIVMAGLNLPWIINPWEQIPVFWLSFDLSLYLYSISYVMAGLVTIKKYRRALEQQQSNTDGVSLIWIDVMAYSQVVIWLIAVSQWLVPIESYNVWVIYVAVAIYIIVMGYLALSQISVQPVKPITMPQSETNANAKEMNDDRFPAVTAKLKRLMIEQKLYLEPTLSIGQLSKKAGYPEYLVSQVINHVHGQTFREYINALRISAAKKMLLDPNNKSSILDIAYASGFTSKSTFNSVFKKLNRQTPSQFRQTKAC